MNFYPYEDFFYLDWTNYADNWLDDGSQMWYTPIQHVYFDEDMRLFSGIIYMEAPKMMAYAMKGEFYFNEDFTGIDSAWLEYMYEDMESYWMNLKEDMGVTFEREWDPWCQDMIWDAYHWDVVW